MLRVVGLTVSGGALGYKQAKFVMRVEARARLAGFYGGRGGYWEDAGDYAGARASDFHSFL